MSFLHLYRSCSRYGTHSFLTKFLADFTTRCVISRPLTVAQYRSGIVTQNTRNIHDESNGSGRKSSRKIQLQAAETHLDDMQNFYTDNDDEGEYTEHTDYHEEEHAAISHQDDRIVGWAPDKIYEIVMNVDKYKEFVPYTLKSTVFKKDEKLPGIEQMEAELEVGLGFVKVAYTSDVTGTMDTTRRSYAVVAVCQNRNIFEHLRMEWTMTPGPKPDMASLHFHVSFKLKGKRIQSVVEKLFTNVVNMMIPAFEDRLRDIHGEPVLLSSLKTSRSVNLVNNRRKRRH